MFPPLQATQSHCDYSRLKHWWESCHRRHGSEHACPCSDHTLLTETGMGTPTGRTCPDVPS